jgi:hypothetical protein
MSLAILAVPQLPSAPHGFQELEQGLAQWNSRAIHGPHRPLSSEEEQWMMGAQGNNCRPWEALHCSLSSLGVLPFTASGPTEVSEPGGGPQGGTGLWGKDWQVRKWLYPVSPIAVLLARVSFVGALGQSSVL